MATTMRAMRKSRNRRLRLPRLKYKLKKYSPKEISDHKLRFMARNSQTSMYPTLPRYFRQFNIKTSNRSNLVAKQTVKDFYCLNLEKELKREYKKVMKPAQRQGRIVKMIDTLERRIDVVCFKVGFFDSIPHARFEIKRGRVSMNGSKNIHWNYRMKDGDWLSLNFNKTNFTEDVVRDRIKTRIEFYQNYHKLPTYLEVRRRKQKNMKHERLEKALADLRNTAEDERMLQEEEREIKREDRATNKEFPEARARRKQKRDDLENEDHSDLGTAGQLADFDGRQASPDTNLLNFSRRDYIICPPSPRPRPHIDVNYSSFTVRWNRSITGPEDCLDWGSAFNERNDVMRNFTAMFSCWKMRPK